jgi:5-formyltetrahydrofolate cyclo-ligase
MKNYCSERKAALMENDDIAVQKADLRAEMRKAVSSFCGKPGADDVSDKAADVFLSSEVYRNAHEIFVFVSLRGEVDTKRIIAKSLVDGKHVAVPRITPGTSMMEFYYLNAELPVTSQLDTGSFGILEPQTQLRKAEVKHFPAHAVVVVPGLAFSLAGDRLGKGRGFYDGYASRIAEAGGNKPDAYAALCFSFQILPSVPHNEDDMKITHIASDRGFETCVSDAISSNQRNKV